MILMCHPLEKSLVSRLGSGGTGKTFEDNILERPQFFRCNAEEVKQRADHAKEVAAYESIATLQATLQATADAKATADAAAAATIHARAAASLPTISTNNTLVISDIRLAFLPFEFGGNDHTLFARGLKKKKNCCRVENVAHIIHHTPMFARLQCPRVSAGRNNRDVHLDDSFLRYSPQHRKPVVCRQPLLIFYFGAKSAVISRVRVI
jgi:hypothetical protein